jgi:hypothetical protein
MSGFPPKTDGKPVLAGNGFPRFPVLVHGETALKPRFTGLNLTVVSRGFPRFSSAYRSVVSRVYVTTTYTGKLPAGNSPGANNP